MKLDLKKSIAKKKEKLRIFFVTCVWLAFTELQFSGNDQAIVSHEIQFAIYYSLFLFFFIFILCL